MVLVFLAQLISPALLTTAEKAFLSNLALLFCSDGKVPQIECRNTDLYFLNCKLTAEHPDLWDIHNSQQPMLQLPVCKTVLIPALFIMRVF